MFATEPLARAPADTVARTVRRPPEGVPWRHVQLTSTTSVRQLTRVAVLYEVREFAMGWAPVHLLGDGRGGYCETKRRKGRRREGGRLVAGARWPTAPAADVIADTAMARDVHRRSPASGHPRSMSDQMGHRAGALWRARPAWSAVTGPSLSLNLTETNLATPRSIRPGGGEAARPAVLRPARVTASWSRRGDAEGLEEEADALFDLVADRADGVDVLAGGVGRAPSPRSACRGTAGRRRRSPS